MVKRENLDGGTSSSPPVIMWFRDDLRLADNPALAAAVASGAPVLAIYVLDDETPGLRRLGGAARWWLHESLSALATSLRAIGAELAILGGRADAIISRLARETGAGLVCWNRRYDEAERHQDSAIMSTLKSAGVAVRSFNGRLLNEPWDVQSKAGTPMKVFTPYWRAARESGEPSPALPAPTAIRGLDMAGNCQPEACQPAKSRTEAEQAPLGS